LITRSKVLKARNSIIKTFDLVPKQSKIIETFDLLPKKSFDLLPNLRETFDQLKRSSKIRSSDQLPPILATFLTRIFQIIYSL
jgi:hypothetical protein